MSIYLELFLNFLKIGVVSFGGGYGMIPLIQETVVSHNWLTETEILNFIAVSESTPGPIAINMATFIGSSQAGFLGALLATLGIVIPSFVIILIIAALAKNLMKLAGVKATLNGIRPAIIGLISGTFITMFLGNIIGVKSISQFTAFNWQGLVIFGIIAVIYFVYKLIRKKALSPIILILFSACLGMLFYGINYS
ncbi:MAG: chromate transporter [Clostridia bacterium]|nr:chromate transporter [Clostridia bacterium]